MARRERLVASRRRILILAALPVFRGFGVASPPGAPFDSTDRLEGHAAPAANLDRLRLEVHIML